MPRRLTKPTVIPGADTTPMSPHKPARRRRSRSRRTSMGGSQLLSTPRGRTATSNDPVINFIGYVQALKSFKAGTDVQALYNGWTAAHGLTV